MGGSTTTWAFLRPEGLDTNQFEKQLKGFDSEIAGWKKKLENIQVGRPCTRTYYKLTYKSKNPGYLDVQFTNIFQPADRLGALLQ